LTHSDDRYVLNTLLLLYSLVQNPGASVDILEVLGLLPIPGSVHHNNNHSSDTFITVRIAH
jgi:hypothetical protein